MDSLQRLTQAVEYLRNNGKAKTQEVIAKDLGRNRTNIAKAMRGNPEYLTDDFLRDFAHVYSEYISEEWLVAGQGEMIKTLRFDIPKKAAKQYADLMYSIIEQKQLFRPHIEAKASAGFMDGLSEGEYGDNLHPLIPGLPEYDFTITAKGDSMFPKIEDGDNLACRKTIDRFNPPIGKVCMLDTKDGLVVKVIKSINEETITLHSLNPAYRDYDIDLNTILGIAQVVGLVREF